MRGLDAAAIALPRDVDAAARREVAFRRAQELIALPALAHRAFRPLREAGLMPLVHKGAALVARYPDRGLRPMDDVDIVVPAERFDDALEVLESAGWTRGVHSLTGWAPAYDLGMTHPDTGGLPIEVHFELQRRSQRTNELDAALLWSERIESSVAGQRVWGLPPELEVLALSTHAAKPFHVFNRLIWAVDLAVITRSCDIDWDVVERRSAALRCRTSVAVALRLARRLGAAVPDEVLELPFLLRRLHALDAVLDPTWPFVVQDRNRRGYAVLLTDDTRARAALLRDEQMFPGRGRSASRAVVEQVRSAGRFLWRAASRPR